MKGITLIGSGDCTHPAWLAEMEEKCAPAENGFYRLKEQYRLPAAGGVPASGTTGDVYFTLSGEISSIYKKNGKVRKVHTVCVFSDFAAARRFQEALGRRGNITSDGRPIVGIDAREILSMALDASADSLVIPAHIWTPWFSVLGDKSGFNSLEECYEDLTKYIFAVETGLSSDPPMNRACSFLDRFRLVSNSDAHSPEKLGREATIFNGEPSFRSLYEALRTGKGYGGTVEFFPQEGKYHYDGHRKCNVCWNPLETVSHRGICPVCGKPVTRGVMYRVSELADRNPSQVPTEAPFYSSVPLAELAAEVAGTGTGSKKASQLYYSLLKQVGPEFHTLFQADIEEIRRNAGDLMAESISRMRCGNVRCEEGFDGEFGRIRMFGPGEIETLTQGALSGEKKACAEQKSVTSIEFDIGEFKSALRHT